MGRGSEANMDTVLRPARLRTACRALVVAGLLAASGAAVPASVTQSFRLTVNLEPRATCSRQVANAPDGPQVKVSCGKSSDARFLFHVSRAGEWLGSVDGEAGNGTITTWRVVHLANRDYLEIMVGW